MSIDGTIIEARLRFSLGHADIRTTQTYCHAELEAAIDAASTSRFAFERL